MNVICDFVMFARSNIPNHIDHVAAFLSCGIGVAHDIYEVVSEHHLEVIFVEDVTIVFGDTYANLA